jgi:hypothetical protein
LMVLLVVVGLLGLSCGILWGFWWGLLESSDRLFSTTVVSLYYLVNSLSFSAFLEFS